jgi:hypothetical protein
VYVWVGVGGGVHVVTFLRTDINDTGGGLFGQCVEDDVTV